MNNINDTVDENNSITIKHSTHQIPKIPLSTPSTEPVYSVPLNRTDKSWNKFNKEEEIIFNQQEIFDCLKQGRVEIETFLSSKELVNMGIVSLKAVDAVSDTVNDNISDTDDKEYSKIHKNNLKSLFIKEATNIISYHHTLLTNSFKIRKRKFNLLKLFNPFHIELVGGRVLIRLTEQREIDITEKLNEEFNVNEYDESIDYNIIDCNTVNYNTVNDNDNIDYNNSINYNNSNNYNNTVIHNNAYSKTLKHKALLFILKVFSISPVIRIIVKFHKLEFQSEIKMMEIEEIRKLLEIEENVIRKGECEIRIEMNVSDYNDTVNINTNNDDDNFIKTSKLICQFVYTTLLNNNTSSLIHNTMKLICLFLAIKFYKTSQFIRVVWERENQIIYYFLRKKEKLRIVVNEGDVLMYHNERIIEIMY